MAHRKRDLAKTHYITSIHIKSTLKENEIGKIKRREREGEGNRHKEGGIEQD